MVIIQIIHSQIEYLTQTPFVFEPELKTLRA